MVFAVWACSLGGARGLPIDGTREIPFEFRDGLIWIQAEVSGAHKPLKFLLDSGAQVSVIDEGVAQRLGLKRGRKVYVDTVGAQVSGYFPQRIEARAGGVHLPREVLMLDLQQLSEACTNGPVEGIVGMDFFRSQIVEIDFADQVVRVLADLPAEKNRAVLPLKVRRDGMLVAIRLNAGEEQWVRLDTGCASALQWVTAGEGLQMCTERIAVALTKVRVPVTRTSVSLGTSHFDDVPTDLHREAIFPGERGLLGNGLLSRFRSVILDTKSRKLFLQKF